MSEDGGLPPRSFGRVDNGDDLTFYAPSRFVTHTDEVAVAVAASIGCCRELLPGDGRVLDLRSSWISHLPSDIATPRWSATA